MTLPSPRSTRFEGVSRSVLETLIFELEAKLASAEQLRDGYLDNLSAVQTRCTQLLEEARLLRRLGAGPGLRRVIDAVIDERSAQDEKWGDLAARSDVPDGTAGPKLVAALERIRSEVDTHCVETERETCCWRHVLEEETAEALAEGDPAHLRKELLQVAAVACLWVEVIDRRAASV